MMYATAGYLLEVITGQTWEDFIRVRICEPLGMTSATVSPSEVESFPDSTLPNQDIGTFIPLIFIAVGRPLARREPFMPAPGIWSHGSDVCLTNPDFQTDPQGTLTSFAFPIESDEQPIIFKRCA